MVTKLIRDFCDPGYSSIYLVDDNGTPKILKVLQQRYNNKPRIIQLFRQEVEVLKNLEHPAIPKADCYFQHPVSNGKSLHCVVMEKIEGCTLKEWLQQHQPIDQKQAIEWLEQIVNILNFVHQRKYLHRDVRANNIMIEKSGKLVLIDFAGAIKRDLIYKTYAYIRKVISAFIFTKTETDGYTPPEQNRNYCLPQSDFFSLGRTFVYLLTGKEPKDESMYDGKYKVLTWRKYAINGVSERSGNLIDKLMTPNVSDRYKNAGEILEEIRIIKEELDANKLKKL
ncbi:serine/threonine-protein kinase [Microcoleus sp. B13-B4]|uniref:serine/threonine-protein kinase n=1 Tax=Microcoleus sp. B13-B4 TaxID=2818651 RepID=UPI002FD64C48